MVKIRRCLGLMLVGAMAAGTSTCAHKLPEPVPEPSGSQSEPHISWAIGVGAGNGEEVHVCQSSPRSVCELRASTAAQPVRSSVHLHLHAGDAGSMFVGEMRATFLAGTAGASTKINNVVLTKREASAGVTGVVVDRPGRYEFSYSVVVSGVGGARTIEDRVEVIIR